MLLEAVAHQMHPKVMNGRNRPHHIVCLLVQNIPKTTNLELDDVLVNHQILLLDVGLLGLLLCLLHSLDHAPEHLGERLLLGCAAILLIAQ